MHSTACNNCRQRYFKDVLCASGDDRWDCRADTAAGEYPDAHEQESGRWGQVFIAPWAEGRSLPALARRQHALRGGHRHAVRELLQSAIYNPLSMLPIPPAMGVTERAISAFGVQDLHLFPWLPKNQTGI